MDKITRILLLYRRFMHGDLINKYETSLEFGISERSFDRDIQDIRLFLSEAYSNLELEYDEKRHGYCIKNLNIRRDITIEECYILIQLLRSSQLLRTDDQEEMVEIVLSQLSTGLKQRVLPVLQRSPKTPLCLNKTSVKLIKDLLFSIEQQDRISLQFGENYLENCCVPYSMEFRGEAGFLIAWDIDQRCPRLYDLGEISSYIPRKYPYVLSCTETSALELLAELVRRKNSKEYQNFIYAKEQIKNDGV